MPREKPDYRGSQLRHVAAGACLTQIGDFERRGFAYAGGCQNENVAAGDEVAYPFSRGLRNWGGGTLYGTAGGPRFMTWSLSAPSLVTPSLRANSCLRQPARCFLSYRRAIRWSSRPPAEDVTDDRREGRSRTKPTALRLHSHLPQLVVRWAW